MAEVQFLRAQPGTAVLGDEIFSLHLTAAAADFALKGFVKAVAAIFGEGSWFGIAEDVDCFSRRVYHYSAILALGKVIFNFRSKRRCNSLIEIIGKLAQDFRALRFQDASPCRK